ncbi:MAG: tetratricopeptide repeat protein [Gammaproteobacteria bacterium]
MSFRTLKYPPKKQLTGMIFAMGMALLPSTLSAQNAPTISVANHAEVQARFTQARQLSQAGKLTQAAAVYEALIDSYPELPDAYNNLAVIYAAQGDYKKAQQVLEKGLNTHAGYAAIYENLTAIYVEMARDSYGKALQFDDTSQRRLQLRALADLSVKPVATVMAEAPPLSAPAAEAPVRAASASVQPVADAEVIPETPLASESAVEVPLSDADVDKDIRATLESWAAAWSAQSLQEYLQYYELAYHPPGQSRRQWQAQRAERIRRPAWIKVRLSDFSIRHEADKRVVVEVRQQYESDTYADQGRKEFILIETDQGWRIVSERNL